MGFLFDFRCCWGVVGEVCIFPSIFDNVIFFLGVFPPENLPSDSLCPEGV